MKKKFNIGVHRYPGILLTVLCMSIFFSGCGSNGLIYQLAAEDDDTDEAEAVSTTEDDGQTNNASEKTSEAVHEEMEQTDNTVNEKETVFVYVCGAVLNSGVYELAAGSRIYQAIDAAGGFTEEAAERMLNLASEVTDGQQITVYTQAEVDAGLAADALGTDGAENVTGTVDSVQNFAGNTVSASSGGKINLNTASLEELQTLSGIGESRAQAIITYRETHGGFTSIDEIKNISGIKEKVFEKIKEEIEV